MSLTTMQNKARCGIPGTADAVPFFRAAVLGQPFTETSPAGFLFIVCQLIKWRGPSPPAGRVWFFWCGAALATRPPSGPRYLISGVPAA